MRYIIDKMLANDVFANFSIRKGLRSQTVSKIHQETVLFKATISMMIRQPDTHDHYQCDEQY